MAIINFKLPMHVKLRKRKGYTDVYFLPTRAPKEWKPHHIGRLESLSKEAIESKAAELKAEYEAFRAGDGKLRRRVITGSLPDLITKYKHSEYWESLSRNTKDDYDNYFSHLDQWSQKNNDPHISKLTTKAMSKFLYQYKDTPRRRVIFLRAFRMLYKIAITEGIVEINLAKDIELPKSLKKKRKKVLWTEEDVDKFVAKCDELNLSSLGSIAMTMIETAQRQGDILKMINGRDYINGKLTYIQNKTGAEVKLPCTQKLKDRYSDYPPGEFLMFVHEKTGKRWLRHNVSHTAREILNSIGMEDHILMDLRPSQTTYLMGMNCTINEIASITGHSIQTVKQMLDRHYAETRIPELAEKVIARIDEERAKRGTDLKNGWGTKEKADKL